jgi:flagellar basal-body rod modification protein FlgD
MVMVNSSSAAVSSTATSSTDSSEALADFDTFLRLLTAQLANQDPLNPTDGTEFTGQLAQFSSLEQQINTNDLLKELIDTQPNTKQSEAMSYIGKDVLAPGNAFILQDTKNVEFTYEVSSVLESANASIYDADGEKVREFNVDASQGIHEVLWDGRNDAGEKLESGVYTVKVEASSINSSGATTSQALDTYVYSEAKKITNLGKSYAVLTADGRTVELEEILGVKEANSTSSSTDHANALQMLGKQILIPGSTFNFSGLEQSFTYGLTKDSQSVTITIKDSVGNKVKQVPFESTAGSHEYTWDGKDSNGDTVDDGEYSIEIVAQNTNAEGEIDEEFLDSLYYGKATKVESSGGVVLMYVDDGRTALYSDVIATKD